MVALNRRLAYPLALAVATQLVGIGSQFLVVIMVARSWGAHGQGEFALVKSWNDFLCGLIIFGLPQAFVYVINKDLIKPRQLESWSRKYCLAIIVPVALANGVAYYSGFLPHSLDAARSIAVLSIAVVLYTYFSLIRGIYLTVNDRLRFSGFTIAPAIVLAISVLASLGGPLPHFEFIYTMVGLASAIVAWIAARPLPPAPAMVLDVESKRIVVSQAFNAFVQSVLIAIQPFVTFAAIRAVGGNLASIGNFNLALVAVLAINAAVAMISPVLYNHWSKTLEPGHFPNLLYRFLAISSVGGLLGGVAFYLGADAVPLIAGEGFDAAIVPIKVMGLISAPLIFTRLCLPALLALGLPALATWTGLCRLASLLIFIAGGTFAGLNALLGSTVAWVVAEWVAAFILFWQTRIRMTGLHGRPEPTRFAERFNADEIST